MKALFAVIKSLQARGISILFVSHKLDEVFEISERFTILRSGENVAAGSTKDLDRGAFAFHMTGREFADESYRPAEAVRRSPCSPSRGYRSAAPIRTSPSTSPRARYLASRGSWIGQDGARRDPLRDSAARLGTIEIGGKPVKIRSVKSAIRKGIGYVPSDRLTEGLFQSQTIARNTVISVLERLSSRLGFLRRKGIAETTAHWISELSIDAADASLPVRVLSGGNQQKVVLARWLANDLSVLILNGPTMGVDIGAKYDIHALVRKLASGGLP